MAHLSMHAEKSGIYVGIQGLSHQKDKAERALESESLSEQNPSERH